LAVLIASVLSLSACGENIFDLKWTEPNVDTVLIYSLARPELNLPTAFDFVGRNQVVIHKPGATGVWDLLLDTQDGQLVFLPPGALDIASDAMIVPLPGEDFFDVIEAPEDTTQYSTDLPVLVDTETVYVVRTHQGTNRFGLPCSFYGKLQPLDADPVLGTVRFLYDVSTLCDDRGLIPEDN